MNSSQKTAGMDRKVLLSTLWIFAMLNYIYADVMTLMQPETIHELTEGMLGGMVPTPGFFVAAALLMETAIVMVLLARILPYGANRWVNIGVGVLHTLSVFASMFVGTPQPFYLIFGTIEIVCTCAIVWLAWTWRPQAA
jgi:hypothetical protein